MKFLVAILALLGAEKPWLHPVPREEARVVAVDGDTIAVPLCAEGIARRTGCVWKRLRIIGIDAPEMGFYETVRGRREYVERPEPCAEAAKTALQGIIARAESLHFEKEGDRDEDAYGRWLRYVTWCPPVPPGQGGVGCGDVGYAMVESGLAREYTFKGQSYDRQAVYRELEKEAKAKKRGLWAGKGCG